TAVVARIEQSAADRAQGTAQVHWSNAGHPPPLVVGPDGATTELTTPEPDLLLGLDPAVPRTQSTFVLRPGATLLLYTDGLIERRDQPLDVGLDLLHRTLGSLAGADPSLDQLCDRLLARLLPVNAQDDVALIAVRLIPR